MAIQLEFMNLIVPVQIIEEKYPGGWDGCLRDHARSLGRVVWYDDHLFRTGAMDPDLMDNLIVKWTRLGFESTEMVGGKTVWKDFCVVTSCGVSRYDCPWLESDPESRSAWKTGTDPGDTINREYLR